MSETMVPTHGLRFVERMVPATEFGENICRTVRILQQRFETRRGPEWRDVPLVTDGT